MRKWIFIVALLVANAARGQDAVSVYKSKCAICHGAQGEGRSAIKGTSLLSAEAKARSDDTMAAAIAKGGSKQTASHAFEQKGVPPPQVRLLVTYIRELQKKR